jgi:hypothetical protein
MIYLDSSVALAVLAEDRYPSNALWALDCRFRQTTWVRSLEPNQYGSVFAP